MPVICLIFSRIQTLRHLESLNIEFFIVLSSITERSIYKPNVNSEECLEERNVALKTDRVDG